MKDSEQIHLIFSEVVNSHSIEFSEKFGELYLKHPNHLESLKVEKQYLNFLSKARDQNLPSNLEREKVILTDGVWTKKEEEDLNNTKDFIRGLKDNISHEYRYSRRQTWKKEINDAERRLDALWMKRDYLIGSTAEKYANQQSFHYQVINSFYLNESLTEKLEIDDTSNEEFEELVEIYNKYQKRMGGDNIKKIAVAPFFSNIFSMSGDNAFYFYGKPIVNLTTHQTNLFMWGRYFKSLMGQYGDRLPKSMSEDTDDMLEWFEITQNAEKMGILKEDDNADGGLSSIIGASKKDLEMLGIDTSRVVNMGARMAKEGKTMYSKEDLYNMTS